MAKRKVLVVEDDPGASKLVGEILRHRDVDVEFVVDGAYALESLRAATPDLIVLDLALPRVDGWEVLNTLQQAKSDIPVIIVTAHGQGSSAERALERGADFFFEKPFIPAELARAVEELLPAES